RTASMDAIATTAPTTTIAGRWIDAPWDAIAHLHALLTDDLPRIIASIARRPAHAVTTLGAHDVVIEEGAEAEPYVVIDATAGPVVIRRGVRIAAFTRIAGPCYIGEDTQLLGGRISGSVFGPECRIHGDVSASIFC